MTTTWVCLLLQAILYGALNQHFCVLLMSMAVDRYWSLAHPHRYSTLFSPKVSLEKVTTTTCECAIVSFSGFFWCFEF